jgi:hypothetical protein
VEPLTSDPAYSFGSVEQLSGVTLVADGQWHQLTFLVFDDGTHQSFRLRLAPGCRVGTPAECAALTVLFDDVSFVPRQPGGTPTATSTVTATATAGPATTTPSPVVPEPSPLWLFGSGLVALGWLVRRNRPR